MAVAVAAAVVLELVAVLTSVVTAFSAVCADAAESVGAPPRSAQANRGAAPIVTASAVPKTQARRTNDGLNRFMAQDKSVLGKAHNPIIRAFVQKMQDLAPPCTLRPDLPLFLEPIGHAVPSDNVVLSVL